MSGGHFDYIQYRFDEVAEEIERLIANESSYEIDEWGQAVKQGFSGATLEKFREAARTMRQLKIMIQRIDYLVSSDDGEEEFHKRWDLEMKALAEREK